MPRYSAVLLNWDNGADLGPIDVAYATDDDSAKALGIMNAFTWCTENGVDRVRVHLVKDGVGLGTFDSGPNAQGT
jgi:hypothetical protein